MTGLDLYGELARLRSEFPYGTISFSAVSAGQTLVGYVMLAEGSGGASLSGTLDGEAFDFTLDLESLDALF